MSLRRQSGGSVLPLYMRSNIFHSITAYANGGSGMYFDVSSTAWQVSRNLVYNVTNAALHWNVNPGVAQAWGKTATPMRFDNNVLIAERDNAYYREGANHSRGGTAGPWGLGNAAITWNGYTPASFTRNVVVVDATWMDVLGATCLFAPLVGPAVTRAGAIDRRPSLVEHEVIGHDHSAEQGRVHIRELLRQ